MQGTSINGLPLLSSTLPTHSKGLCPFPSSFSHPVFLAHFLAGKGLFLPGPTDSSPIPSLRLHAFLRLASPHPCISTYLAAYLELHIERV